MGLEANVGGCHKFLYLRPASKGISKVAKSTAGLWTDLEIKYAVEAYVFLLRAQGAGLSLSEGASTRILLANHLASRNEASIRYRMRNISAVARELGGPVLKAYSPAEQVGGNVRARIRDMLVTNVEFQNLASHQQAGVSASTVPRSDQAEVIERLKALRTYLTDVERQVLGVGHNQPPEPLSSAELSREDFDRARADIDALEKQVSAGPHDARDEKATKRHSESLLAFGLKIAVWVGARATKFTDVALTVLAPVVVAKVTGLAPIVINAISAAAHLLKPQ